ncbi:MAG: SCO family protein [Proteobacteria bacterium]|jgi:protein SCO1/2|nr:SCO family protein [Pseudomonadota bacterium]
MPRRLLIVLATFSLLLSACSHAPSPWLLTDVRGHLPDLRFHLINDLGQPVTGASYRGKAVLLYFGYTHCPDVCPTTLAHLTVVLQNLGPLAQRVRVLFVSVDPKRDTPALLRAYTSAFGPHIIGLTGTPDAIARVAKRYRVAYSYGKPDAAGNYVVNHSAAIFIFDPQGRARLLATEHDSVAQLTHDLHLLLTEPKA